MSALTADLPGWLLQVIYFFLALFPLVLIHELGHFVLAKLNGVRVDEFGIGFPPRLFTVFSAGGTDYTINLLPLGGFVRLAGEDDPDVPGAFASRPKRARAAVLLAGPIANFLLAALIFSGIAYTLGAASPLPQAEGLVQLLAIGPGSPAEAAGLKSGDIVVAVDGELLSKLPVTAPLVEGQSRASEALIETTDAHSGRDMQLTILRGVRPVNVEPRVDALDTEPEDALGGLEGFLASRVTRADGELLVGDVLLQPEGAAAGEVIVLRGALERVDATVVPEANEAEGRAMMGVSIGVLTVSEPMGFVEALVFGPKQTVWLMGAMTGGLYQMITGQIDADVAGPVGISKMSQQAGEQGLATFFSFMALLSINLGIINLIPIPALDGGRLLFILLEALRGRRIEPNREAVVHLIGFALVIGLMLVITVYEVFGGSVRP